LVRCCVGGGAVCGKAASPFALLFLGPYRLCPSMLARPPPPTPPPPPPPPPDNWSIKAKRRKVQGTGRMRHLGSMARRFKNGLRERTEAKSQKKAATA
jgi:hypothetical protein